MELTGFVIVSGVVNSGLRYSRLLGCTMVDVGDRCSCCHGIRNISRIITFIILSHLSV